MQAHLLVGPIPTVVYGSGAFICSTSSAFLACFSSLPAPPFSFAHHRNRFSNSRKWDSVVVASSTSWAATNGGQDHYAVLGITANATLPDIKRAYRLLARKYHPDVSKHSQAGELFKSIRHAYEILSNEVTRSQYDRVVRFREDYGKSYNRKQYYRPEFEDESRFYKWDEVRRRRQPKEYWENYDAEEDSFTNSYTATSDEEGNLNQERGPFSEVLGFAFISLFLLQAFGSQISLAFSCAVALFDWKLDSGYKVGHLIAWILGGRGGIFLALCLQFASWTCGKTSSSVVALIVVAMWVGSNLARYAPLPPGAVLTLLYMSMKLQADLK